MSVNDVTDLVCALPRVWAFIALAASPSENMTKNGSSADGLQTSQMTRPRVSGSVLWSREGKKRQQTDKGYRGTRRGQTI